MLVIHDKDQSSLCGHAFWVNLENGREKKKNPKHYFKFLSHTLSPPLSIQRSQHCSCFGLKLLHFKCLKRWTMPYFNVAKVLK